MLRIGAVIGSPPGGRAPGGRAPGGAGIGVMPPGPLRSTLGIAVSGAVKLRGESSPHAGHGALDGAVPIGMLSSNTPSVSQRKS